jgi:CubicO group peptidase (beta-lactamase class C family)
MMRSRAWLALGFLYAVGLPCYADGPGKDDFSAADPAASGIDAAALERLRKRAEETDSDAVVVIKDGRLVVDWTFGKPETQIEAMSATKSVVSLAIGRLIDDAKIASVDQPVCDFYPEWKQGRKKRITIRHLLNHTSGLQDYADETENRDCPDLVQCALVAELSDDPGAKFHYNNKAVNLLAGIVQRASGQRMDRYIGETIFQPLGITDVSWLLDGAGNPHGMAGLQIRARDFAKVGQMMLDRGVWRGRRIVSERWVELSTQPAQALEPKCGLLWWVVQGEALSVDDAFLDALKAYGPSDATLAAVAALKDKPIEGTQFWPAVGAILRKDEAVRKRLNALDQSIREGKGPVPKRAPGRPVGFAAAGYLGQHLVVLPELRLVAVRQFRSPSDANRPRDLDPKTIDNFSDFISLVRALVPPRRPQ